MSYLIMLSFTIAGVIWFTSDVIKFIKKKCAKKEDK